MQTKGRTENQSIGYRTLLVFATVLLLGAGSALQARAANLAGLTVVDGAGTPVTDYRWLVEEDKTYHVGFDGAGNPVSIPGDPGFDPNWENTLSVSFHKSYMPVMAKGCVNMPAEAACTEVPFTPEPDKHYFVSVLPRAGYALGGAGFKTDGSGNIPPTTVYVNPHPIPTAQISIFIFHDNMPINGAPDTPEEDPAISGEDMSGFRIQLEDAGGRYGASAGIQSTDVYGNPLGTTYLNPGTGTCPVGGTPYDPVCVDVIGSGIFTGPDGWAHIYNLAPGKYGISAIPPAGQGWKQTSTIEGTPVIDAWVKANEPPFFAEFGPAGPHVFIGFVKQFADPAVIGAGPATISGTVVNQHMSRPPDYAMYNGGCFGHTTPWVGLNNLAVGTGSAVWSAPTDGNCNFTIPNVPDGNYQLVVWDSNLDLIITFKAISIAGGACNTPSGTCALGEVPVFQWFHRQEHFVFNDENANGIWDPGEGPLSDVTLNLRWRDGTVYQTNVTDFEGAFAFDQVFPFFSWLVAEVGFDRLQATGVRVTADNGGPIDPTDPWTWGGQLNPQDQTNPPDSASSDCTPPFACTETTKYRVVSGGPVLLEAFQGFIGQTHAFEWGKRHYPDGENGGITGVVYYDVTRAENNPEQAGAEPWEPGIPGVTVNLYDSTGTILLNTTTTDSWDENIPTGCKWGNDATGPFVFSPDGGVHTYPRDCYDGLRVFNQVRPGVFDGGYAFSSICADAKGMASDGSCATFTSPMPIGQYVVQVVPPPGYEIYKPEDKNVDFGDVYTPPTPALLPPPCVGDPHTVPQYLTLHPDEMVEVVGWAAGMTRPLCDKKRVTIGAGTNSAADFFLFTEVPVAAHGIGFILDDTQNEFDPNAPNFGEKYAPPFMPVSIRDWTGREIGRTYSDQYGVYNFLVPSTATTNIPAPSGMSPNMLTACMNDATLPDGTPDPQHNPIYSQFCYTLQYMPGVYTYLDTPVIPIGAFAGPDQFPVDCEFADGTPRIQSVNVQTNGVGGGPYIPTYAVTGGPPAGRGVFTSGLQTITITSMGLQPVPNPNYCNPAAGPCPATADKVNKTIPRDYGFGTGGTVTLCPAGNISPSGSCTSGGVPLTNVVWNNTTITANVAANTSIGTIGGRQLTVTRNGGQSTKTGVTVQFGLRGSGANLGKVVQVFPAASTDLLARPITDAINAPTTTPNDLILVHPGVYNEMVVMSKPVQLQGYGEGSTKINALKQPAEKLTNWRTLVESLITGGQVNLLPGQTALFGGIEPPALQNEEGAGVLVLAPSGGNGRFDLSRNMDARIDGFTITGADTGGGIVVNGYGNYMEISNNRIVNNQGAFGGGVRVGHPLLTNTAGPGGAPAYTDGQNDFVRIHHNTINQNGGLGGAGAGISLGTGSDSYAVTRNWVCGNFNTGDGGGIGHIGLSNRPNSGSPLPRIANNTIIFNETFLQGATVSGGGLYIAGAPPLGVGTLSPGAGNVLVISNLIQGNAAGAGDGGGIRLDRVNGQDVAASGNSNNWYGVDLFNNMVVNNVAGLAGGGISLQDAVKVRIIHDSIANNDSLGTAGPAFLAPTQSTPQPGAGIVARAHSALLSGTGRPIGAFSDPRLEDSIIWHNRKFFFHVEGPSGGTAAPSIWGLCPDIGGTIAGLNCPGGNTPVYDDLAVLGAVGLLTCDTPATSCFTSANGDPLFVQQYANGARVGVGQENPTTAIQAPPAFDEGGNFIRPRFGPLSINVDVNSSTAGIQLPNYHIQSTSPARNTGINRNSLSTELTVDFDGQTRPQGTQVDRGADEYWP